MRASAAGNARKGAVSIVATKAVSPLLGAASYRHAVKQLLTSVAREICMLRPVGAGERETAPGHPVGAISDGRSYRDSNPGDLRRFVSWARNELLVTNAVAVMRSFELRPGFKTPVDDWLAICSLFRTKPVKPKAGSKETKVAVFFVYPLACPGRTA
jgi:hypothetical protein